MIFLQITSSCNSDLRVCYFQNENSKRNTIKTHKEGPIYLRRMMRMNFFLLQGHNLNENVNKRYKRILYRLCWGCNTLCLLQTWQTYAYTTSIIIQVIDTFFTYELLFFPSSTWQFNTYFGHTFLEIQGQTSAPYKSYYI